MSYQVLARKWRPKTFTELMGQAHVVTVLVNSLEQQRLHHAYLFTGTRGVGKTTIARIFAKSLNCEQGITSTPCGQCDTCVDIDKGRFVDLLEIDAASRTKVDDTREILDNVQYAPTRGRYKVYLIDEVHMLSRSSFNALLKTLEEPPEHVKFILATTDPQKLPVTVLSRCLQFHLKALTVSQIETQLKTILASEAVEYENAAITLLAKAARGSMRDSLSLTDQGIAQGKGNITLVNIQQMLGGVDQNWIFKIIIALIKQDSSQLMTLSLEIASYAPSYNRLLADLIQLLHQIAMRQIVDRHFDLSPEHNQLLVKFSQTMSPEDVQLYYQIVLNGRKDLPYAADEQAAFDMVLLRLLAFKPMSNVAIKDEISEQSLQVCEVTFDGMLAETVEHSDTVLDDAINTVADSDVLAQEREQQLAPDKMAGTLLDDTINTVADSDVLAQEREQRLAPVQMTGTVLDDAINTVADSDVLAEEREQLLAAQMAGIESDAEQQLGSQSSGNSALTNNPGYHQPPQAFNELITEKHDSEIARPSLTSAHNVVNDTVDIPTENIQAPRTAIDSVLATRNMLRSRKKELEKSGKKSNDATTRHDSQASSQKNSSPLSKQQEKRADVPDLATLSEQPFTVDIIDPAIIKSANQVDKWANMIDSMALGGRLRQLAIHATICESSTDDLLILLLDQATKHLKTDVAHQQLETELSTLLSRHVIVELRVVEKTEADPYKIQSHINDKRYDYAVELLKEDSIVKALQSQFQAELNVETITAR
ncbi:MAG: DNA polymerase-3 subunit gamma/tau [Alteromonadaceae bacterium]|jgi:DNA polymerase-3 subunit gamma/tau